MHLWLKGYEPTQPLNLKYTCSHNGAPGMRFSGELDFLGLNFPICKMTDYTFNLGSEKIQGPGY